MFATFLVYFIRCLSHFCSNTLKALPWQEKLGGFHLLLAPRPDVIKASMKRGKNCKQIREILFRTNFGPISILFFYDIYERGSSAMDSEPL